MSGQQSIFESFVIAEIESKKTRCLKRLRTGQIVALLQSMGLTIVSWPTPTLDPIDNMFFIIFLSQLIIAILAFKWPFAFMLTHCITTTIFSMVFAAFTVDTWKAAMNDGSHTELLLIAIAGTCCLTLITRGTIAARKYNKLNKAIA